MNQLISSITDRANVLLVSNSPNDVRELLYVLDRHNLGTGLAGDIDEGVELAAGGTDLILLDAAWRARISAPPACAWAMRAEATACPCC